MIFRQLENAPDFFEVYRLDHVEIKADREQLVAGGGRCHVAVQREGPIEEQSALK